MSPSRCVGLCAALALACSTGGCLTVYVPPTPRPERSDFPIAASFGRTWDAVIDFFARESIGVKTIERASGFIVAEWGQIPPLLADPTRGAVAIADCGTEAGVIYYPSSATFNVVVRGDSTRSTLHVTMAYASYRNYLTAYQVRLPCVSTGWYEGKIEGFVRDRAEAKR
jgi:hypothetical protein